jgi:thiamine pyrophosphokinase
MSDPKPTRSVDTNVETVVVITGAGALHPAAVASIPSSAVVIAADGALDHALAAGVLPAGLVGDLDSISAEGLAWAKAHATIHRHPVDKDRTDTELALVLAAELAPARVMLIGGGDRLDHTIAAIGALGLPELTAVPTLEGWWGAHRLRVVHGPGRARIDLQTGSTLSLLALHGACSGVTIDAVRWPLHRADLAAAVGLGVSNVATADSVAVSISTGILTVIIPADVIASGAEPAGRHRETG